MKILFFLFLFSALNIILSLQSFIQTFSIYLFFWNYCYNQDTSNYLNISQNNVPRQILGIHRHWHMSSISSFCAPLHIPFCYSSLLGQLDSSKLKSMKRIETQWFKYCKIFTALHLESVDLQIFLFRKTLFQYDQINSNNLW